MCFFISGAYYSFDNPAELENVLEKKFQISMTEYSLLYSLYSLPNTIIPFLGGIFIDSAGYYAGLIISSVIVTIGQTIIAVGGYQGSFHLMLVGRFIFGIGSETLWVVQALYVSNWFFDQELSLAMGIS